MNILEFKQYFEPEIAGGIALDANTAEDLAEKGHDVYLFTPRHTRGITKETIKATPKYETRIDGRLKIHRYKMFGEKKNIYLRAIRYILCACKQLWHGLRLKNVDLIFAGSTPPFQGIVVALIKRVKKVPFVFNLQDIFPDSMLSAGIAKQGGLIWNIGEWIAKRTYETADHIIVISEAMRDNLLEKNVPKEKIHIVYNWVDEKAVHPIARYNNSLYLELGIPDYEFTVVYAGNLGLAQGIEVILKAAKRLNSDKRIGFVIFGNGANEEMVRKFLLTEKLEHVHLYPLQPYEKVSEVYSIGDACLVCGKSGLGKNAMPSKTWSIMACGKPILASFDSNSLLEKIIVQHDCGLFSKAEDDELLAASIMELAQNKERALQMGKNARKFIENNLSRKPCTDKICNVIQQAYDEYYGLKETSVEKG